MIPNLETERLYLRPFYSEDAAEVQRLAGDYDVYKSTLNVPHPYLDGMAESWIAAHPVDAEMRHLIHWAMVVKQTNALIGCVSVGISTKRCIGEVGYWLGKDYWNKGYGTEASRCVINYGFETLELNRFYGRHFDSNPASGKIMQKCGMVKEGVLRHDQIKDGEFVDICYYGLLRNEWEEIQRTGNWNL